MSKQYPEIIEDWLTSQAKNTPDVIHYCLTNVEVKRCAIQMLKQKTKGKTTCEEQEAYHRFMDFCARACELLFITPPAATKRGPLYYEFATPGELAAAKRRIARDIESLRETLTEHQSWFHAPELLAALAEVRQHPQLSPKKDDEEALPRYGGFAGRNGWRNYLYRQLWLINEATQARYSDTFLIAMANSLSMADETLTLEPSNARYMRRDWIGGALDEPL